MATGTGIRWRPGQSPRDLAAAIEREYGTTTILAAVKALAEYFEPILESHAKATAPWTDRTGNARQTLFSVSELAKDVVTLYLSHGMEYGVYLELRYSGKYAVIMPTLQAHYGEISQALKDLFR